MSQKKNLTQEQQLAEAKLKMMLERHLTEKGWPEKARDYAIAEVMQTVEAQSHVLGGASAPDADELAFAVFATPRGALLKALIDEAAEQDSAVAHAGTQSLVEKINGITNRAARIDAARKAGLA